MAESKKRQRYNDDVLHHALELHKRRLPLSQIAIELGVSQPRACGLLKAAKERASAEMLQSAKDTIVSELLMLDDIVKANYEQAIDEGNMRAQDQLLKVHDRKVKLLGLENADITGSSKSEFSQIDVENIEDKDLESVFNDIFTS